MYRIRMLPYPARDHPDPQLADYQRHMGPLVPQQASSSSSSLSSRNNQIFRPRMPASWGPLSLPGGDGESEEIMQSPPSLEQRLRLDSLGQAPDAIKDQDIESNDSDVYDEDAVENRESSACVLPTENASM
jgi:hypothetical protein